MSEPAAGNATTPSNQRTRRTRTMVHSICTHLLFADGLARKVRAMGDVALARPRPVPLSDAVPARLTLALSPSKRERPSAEAEGRSSGGRTLVTALRADLG